MDGLGFILMAGLLFFPVVYLGVYCIYASLGWRQILADWSYPEDQMETGRTKTSETHRIVA